VAALDALQQRLREAPNVVPVEGSVVSVRGFTVRAAVSGVRIGERVTIQREGTCLDAEVVGFEDSLAVLMPLGNTHGVGLDDRVVATGHRGSFSCGVGLLGRVLDALGEPLDNRGAVSGTTTAWAYERASPAALRRARVREVMPLGVRVLDAMTPLAIGQRVGVFAAPGVGKSRLLAEIARNTHADAVVLALVGERGREVREFLEDALDDATRARTCTVVATSDEAPVLRVRAAHTAMAVAEFLRDEGRRVLLLLDSVTRVARAQREVGLAAGEPAVRRGYPPSVFALIPRLLERAGPGERGSITLLCSVLVEGSDVDDPIADETRSVLDGHIVLERTIAEAGRWPAVDVLRSLSRGNADLLTTSHRTAAARVRAWLSALEANRDLVAMGAYVAGRNPTLDQALARRAAIEAFFAQPVQGAVPFDESIEALVALTNGV
jgi:type III secretion protein N (ATPase)